MTIENYFRKEFCLPDLNAETKEGAIREICSHLLHEGICTGEPAFLKKILDRETMGSTGIGNGVAVPHAYLRCVSGVFIGFARSKKGIDFGAVDGKKVHLIFVVGANPENLNTYLNVLADISKAVMMDFFRERLMTAKDAREIVSIFRKFGFMEKEEEACWVFQAAFA